MTYRKTWFSYVLWAAYAGLCVMLLAFVGFYLYSTLPFASMFKLGALVIFPITVAVYWVVREVSLFVRKKYVMHVHTAQMLEAFVVALSVVFGILYRVIMVLYSGMYADIALAGQQPVQEILEVPYATYYDMALVRAGEQLTPLTHGAGYLYVLCVSAVCSFLGNKFVSAVMLQAVVQIISIILSYAVVRNTAGKLPACIVLIYLSFSGIYIGELYRIDPDSFVFMLYLAGLLLVTKYIKKYCGNYLSRPMAILGAVFAGLVTGILVYLDLKLVILLVFMVGLFTGKKTKPDEGQSNHGVGITIASFLVLIAACAVGVCIMFEIVALYRGTSFGQDVSAWFSLYTRKSQVDFFYLINDTRVIAELPVIVMLMMSASFLVFEFLKCRKEQNFTLWILACLLIAPTPMMKAGILPYTAIALFQWSVLAGLGLQNCIFGGQAKVVQAKIEEINASVEPIEEGKPRFIENPLPLPKKHVKKEMDYQYPVEDKDMKYDIDVDENDDFDIQ